MENSSFLPQSEMGTDLDANLRPKVIIIIRYFEPKRLACAEYNERSTPKMREIWKMIEKLPEVAATKRLEASSRFFVLG